MGFFDSIKRRLDGGATPSLFTNASKKIQGSSQGDIRELRSLAKKGTDFRTGKQKQAMGRERGETFRRLGEVGLGGGMTTDQRRQSFDRSRQAFRGQSQMAIDPRSPGAAFNQRRQNMRSQAAAADIARRTMGADMAMRRQFDAENMALANMFTRMQTAVDQRRMQDMLQREQELMELAGRHAAKRRAETSAVTGFLGTFLGSGISNIGNPDVGPKNNQK